MNYIENLPFDLQELISKKLHNLYMYDLKDEIYEACLDYQWRLEDIIKDPDYSTESESESESDYSYVSDESF